MDRKETNTKPSFRPIGDGSEMQVKLRFDDECANGHNTFAITAEVQSLSGKEEAGGCLHEEIAEHFPELTPLIRWHLCSTDGPLHYIANTRYQAGDRDCWGKPGKVRELDAARNSACWQEATDAELTEPGLENRLAERLPALLAEFRSAMENAGLGWEYSKRQTRLIGAAS